MSIQVQSMSNEQILHITLVEFENVKICNLEFVNVKICNLKFVNVKKFNVKTESVCNNHR